MLVHCVSFIHTFYSFHPAKTHSQRHWDHLQCTILGVQEHHGRNRSQYFIRKGKYSVTRMMCKKEASWSLKGTKWVSSRAGSRSKKSWLIIYSIHEAVHIAASKWYNSQPSHSSLWKRLCKDEARLGSLCLLWLTVTQILPCFTGSITETLIPVFSAWSIVMILILMRATHPSQWRLLPLHPVLLQWVMLMHCASLRGISIMHHFKIALYSTVCSN